MNDHQDRHAQLVAAIAVRLPGRTVSFAKAARLAYLADREAMRRHGFPVVDDQRVATPGGVAFCIGVLQAMQEGSNPELPATGERTPGIRLFSTTEDMGCTVDDAVRDEDLDLFSRAEIDVIDDVVDRWGGRIDSLMSGTDVFPELHGLRSWMEVTEIAMFSALGDTNPQSSAERLEDHRRIDRLFESMRTPLTRINC
ncbi:hypothetical protein [Rhizobium leguminosarum]|uniref:hypothetical protein n=1 Tax=Rhizobium leguminosarum TaxID=384 RepID=UPI002E1150F3|nr:hypothetical protein U8Q02_40265 [Rhizobium leguminosarum]